MEKNISSCYVSCTFIGSRFCGKIFSANSMTIIEQFIRKYYLYNSTTIWEQLTHYQARSGIFDMLLVWETINKVNPIDW